MKRLAVLRTVVPALLAVSLVGVLPNWVSLAEAEGYDPGSPQASIINSANVVTTALSGAGAISAAIGGRTGGGSNSTAGGFRIDGIRFGGMEFEGRSPLVEDSAAGARATGDLSGFLTAVGGLGDQTGAVEYSNGGLVGGIDYQFSDQVVGGLAINWITTDVDFAGGGGGSNSDTYGASLYAAYSVGGLNVSGLFNYSFSDYSNTRVIGLGDVAVGNNNSDQIFLSGSTTYEYDLSGGWVVGPVFRFDLVKVWMDGYSETGSITLNTQYDAFDVTSFTTDIGLDAGWEIKTDAGLITPRVHAYWVHEYENDAQVVSGSLIGGAAFAVLTDSPDRNYWRLGVGATMQLEEGLQIYFDFESIEGFTDVNSYQFAAGGRFEF